MFRSVDDGTCKAEHSSRYGFIPRGVKFTQKPCTFEGHLKTAENDMGIVPIFETDIVLHNYGESCWKQQIHLFNTGSHCMFVAQFVSLNNWSRSGMVPPTENNDSWIYPKPPFLKSSNLEIDDLTVYDPILTSYFCIWLFTLDDCLFSQPLTLDVNHRSVSHRDIVYGDQSAYHNLSVLGEKSSSEEGFVLKPEEITVLPYCVDNKDRSSDNTKTFSDLKSIAKTNCNWTDGLKQDVKISITDIFTRSPMLSDYEILLETLNFNNSDTCGWPDIFGLFFNRGYLGGSIKLLNELCQYVGAPFEFFDNCPVFQANILFKKWFQWSQPIRFAFVDGNHRAWSISRFFSGRQFIESIPYQYPGQDRVKLHSNILRTQVSVRFIYPDPSADSVIDSLQKMSQKSQQAIKSRTVFQEDKHLWGILMTSVESHLSSCDRFENLMEFAGTDTIYPKNVSSKMDQLLKKIFSCLVKTYLESERFREINHSLNQNEFEAKKEKTLKELELCKFGTAHMLITTVRSSVLDVECF